MLAAKLDECETIRRRFRKPWPPKSPDKKRIEKPTGIEKTLCEQKHLNNIIRERKMSQIKYKGLNYSRNISPLLVTFIPVLIFSPIAKKNAERVNNLGVYAEFETPYLSTVHVNNVEGTIIRETGISVDLMPRNLYRQNYLMGMLFG